MTQRPTLGDPPYAIALSVSGAPSSARAAVVQRLTHVLNVSGLFRVVAGSPADEPGARGAAHSMATIALDQAGGLTGRVAIQLPGAGAEGDTARAAVAAATPRRLALDVAALICRHHLDDSGPFLTKIAFVAPSAGSRGRQVFLSDFDGQGVERASRELGSLNILPAWSRSGDLAFTSFATGGPQLALVAAGSVAGRVLPSHGGLNSGAAFSPNGQLVALSISRGGNTDVHLVDRSGRLRRRLTRHKKIDISPSFAPDGRRIALVSDRSGSPQVYVLALSPSGAPLGQPRRLTTSGSYNQEPSWCPLPGSELVAYSRRYRGERYAIHVVNAATGESRRLTSPGRTAKRPSWSPRCRALVYANGNRELRLVTADGRSDVVLYRGTAQTPAWSPPLRTLP